MGPHNTSLHKVSSLFQAYKKFLETGKNYINGPLKAKTLKLEELMLQIDNALNDSKSKAKELLKQISAEYEDVLEKINKLDGNKKAELSFNSSEFQKDMLNIQRILETLDQKNLKCPK
jgi:GTP-binding protein EngB required for normal cell division